jgi:hypothetical protein
MKIKSLCFLLVAAILFFAFPCPCVYAKGAGHGHGKAAAPISHAHKAKVIKPKAVKAIKAKKSNK